jgi:hypothetical protein
LYQPGKLEGERKCTTDLIWSVTTHSMRNAVQQEGQPVVYYLNDGPQRGFVREELMIVPEGTELPPDKIIIKARRSDR